MSFSCTQILIDPELVTEVSLSDWDVVVPQGGNADLLGALWYVLKDKNLLDGLPAGVHRHLYSAAIVHKKQRQNLIYELKWLERALSEIGVKLILLKGAAYFAADLPAARGRMMADIDLLVPPSKLDEVESVLGRYGWETGDIHPYDDHYFRKWMHEIPALGHESRESTLDVHHTILPPTANANINAEALFESIEEARDGIFVLSPIDMVIHSATHLFHEGEFVNGMRSLWDLDRLLRDFEGKIPDFWQRLVPRAEELDLLNPLHHALRQTQQVFSTPVPDSVHDALRPKIRHGYLTPVMDFMFKRAFSPDHSSTRLPFTQLSLFVLYIRGHYLRMPIYLLVPHLVRKAWMRVFERPTVSWEDEQGAAEP